MFHPDAAGPRTGAIVIRFGAADEKKAPVYEVSVPGESEGPITMTRMGNGVTLAFEGRTKDGTHLRIKAVCAEIDSM